MDGLVPWKVFADFVGLPAMILEKDVKSTLALLGPALLGCTLAILIDCAWLDLEKLELKGPCGVDGIYQKLIFKGGQSGSRGCSIHEARFIVTTHLPGFGDGSVL